VPGAIIERQLAQPQVPWLHVTSDIMSMNVVFGAYLILDLRYLLYLLLSNLERLIGLSKLSQASSLSRRALSYSVHLAIWK
jgi:hypothetical protein